MAQMQAQMEAKFAARFKTLEEQRDTAQQERDAAQQQRDAEAAKRKAAEAQLRESTTFEDAEGWANNYVAHATEAQLARLQGAKDTLHSITQKLKEKATACAEDFDGEVAEQLWGMSPKQLADVSVSEEKLVAFVTSHLDITDIRDAKTVMDKAIKQVYEHMAPLVQAFKAGLRLWVTRLDAIKFIAGGDHDGELPVDVEDAASGDEEGSQASAARVFYPWTSDDSWLAGLQAVLDKLPATTQATPPKKRGRKGATPHTVNKRRRNKINKNK